MDTEEFVRKCSGITLQEEEKNKITMLGSMKEKGWKLAANCLVGKVVLNKRINTEGLRAALHQVWRTIKKFKVESVGNNIFIFKFNSKEEKKRVFTGGPWHFAGALIVMIEPKGIGDVNDQQFTHASFWVQIHYVPLMCMHKGAIQKFGEKIGVVEEIETDDNGECIGLYARLRISLNITHSLKKILFIEEEDTKKTPMAVVYERLPDLCFCCGILGHQYRECLKYRGQPKDKLLYGSWLKAKTAAERAKLNRDKGGWSKEHHKPNSPPTNLKQQQLQHLQPHPVSGGWLRATHAERNKNAEQMRGQHVAKVGEGQSMHNTEKLRQTLTSSKVQANIANIMDSTRTLCQKEGKSNGKETEVENERGNLVEWITKKL